MFLANYADVLTDAPLPEMIDRFRASSAVVSLLAVPPQSSHHVVDIGEDGLITQVTPMQDLRQWENGGYFVFRPEIFEHLSEGADLVEDAIVRLVPQGRVLAYPYKGYWSPADTVKERAQLEEMYQRGNCPWMIWDPERSGQNRDASKVPRRPGEAVLPLLLEAPAARPLSVLAIGAHPDDIEIGAGGLLLTLAGRPLRATYVVLTGTADRHEEARAAARAFLPDADLTVSLHQLPEGRLPAAWAQAKEILEDVARTSAGAVDVVLAPSCDDAHQDHRTIGEIVPSVFRDQLYLAYEIPKWDGDLSRPSVYVPLSDEIAAAQGGAAAQVLPVAARPRLVGRRGLPRPGPAARHGVPGPVRRGVPVRQVAAPARGGAGRSPGRITGAGRRILYTRRRDDRDQRCR